MSKEERYTYHCDQYDYIEIIYDNEECEEIDSMKMAEKRLNRQQDKIADLEAKLAVNKKWLASNEGFLENQKLKQQLAEKEKERHEEWKTGKEWKWEWQKVNSKLEKADRDKISFCIEKLEKVKELLLENLYDLYSKPSEIWDKYGDLYDVVVEGAVNGTIDNQIKAIKEMK